MKQLSYAPVPGSLGRRVNVVKTVLARMAFAEIPEAQRMPEHNLWLSVVLDAVTDMRSVLTRDGAERYFRSAWFGVHADWCGLDPQAVREVLYQASLLGGGGPGSAVDTAPHATSGGG